MLSLKCYFLSLFNVLITFVALEDIHLHEQVANMTFFTKKG